MHANLQNRKRIPINRQQRMIGLQHRLIDCMAADIPAIDDDGDPVPVRSRQLRLGDKARQRHNPGFSALDRQHRFGRSRAVNRRDNLQPIAGSKRTQQHIAVMLERKGDAGMRKRQPVTHNPRYGQARFESFSYI